MLLILDANSPLALKFRLLIQMNIIGLISTRSTSAQISDADCPVELPLNAG